MSAQFQDNGSPNILIILKRLSNWDDPELRMALAYRAIIGSNSLFSLLIIGQSRKSTPLFIFKKLSSLGIKILFFSDRNLESAYDFISSLPRYKNVFCLSDISSKVTPTSLLVLSGLFGKVILNMSTILSTGSPHLQVITSCSKYSIDACFEYSETSYAFPNGGAFFLSRPFYRNLSTRIKSTPPALVAFTSQHKFNHEFKCILISISESLAIPIHLYPFAPHFSNKHSSIIDELTQCSGIKAFTSDQFDANSCQFNYLLGLSSPAYPNVTSLVDLMYYGIPTISWVSKFKRKNMGCLFNQILGLDHFNLNYDCPANLVGNLNTLLARIGDKHSIQRALLTSAIIV